MSEQDTFLTAQDPIGQHQGSRPFAGPDFLSMRRILVLYYQPIRFARFDSESVNRGFPVFEPPRGILGAGQKDRGL